MKRRLALLALPALLPLLVVAAPAAAAAATYTITADRPEAVPAGSMWAFDDYFPRGLTVAQGSTLQVPIEGFHTFTLLASGTTVAADNAAKGIGMADDQGSRNINRSRRTALNFAALAPQLPSACGTAATPCSFDGRTTLSSGAPQGTGPAAPFVVTIDAPPGTYVFHCRIHPNMVGAVRVVSPGSAADTPAQADAKAAAQVKVDVAEAKVAETRASVHAAKRNPNGTTTWRVSAGTMSANRRVSILEFLPRNITLHRGDRVLWVAPDPDEPHTITFPTDLHTDQVPMCDTSTGDTPAQPTVTPPTGPQDFACPGGKPVDEVEFDGGNGVRRLTSPTTVADSGFIAPAALATAYGVPGDSFIHTWSVTVQPTAVVGTYTYVCQVHDGMAGTLTVH